MVEPHLSTLLEAFWFLDLHGRDSSMSLGGLRLEAMTSWLDEFGYTDSRDERETFLTYWHQMDLYWRGLRMASGDQGKHIPTTLPKTYWGETEDD